MGWLIGQMWLLIAASALLGLIIGCWLCSRKKPVENDDQDIELARLRSSIEECQAAKNNLRSQVAELESQLNSKPNPAPVTVPTFYDSPDDGDPDDLKKIKGIGPKLETLCHGMGVYYYRQIANWNASQVAEVDQKLSFKGRIDRDDWREQARKLINN
jgi:predicted flap endonuclease-1-like 5' DNA nuclease